MRVAHVLNQVSVTASALDQIQGSVAAGYDVVVIASGADAASRSCLGGLGVPLRLVGRRFLSPFGIIEMMRAFRTERPDVVHLHHARSGLTGAIAARIAGIPCLVEDGAQRDNYRLPTRILFTASEILADRVVFVSHSAKASLSPLERTLIRASKCAVVYYGVATTPVPQSLCREERDLLGIATGDTVFCHTGRFVPVKRQDLILELFALLRQRLPASLKLVMVGDGPERVRLEALAGRLGLTGTVVFTGMVPRERVYQILAISDFFVMMSRTEGQGVSLLEAMMYGGVPILSRIGVFEETVDKEVAIYYDTADQLVADVRHAAGDLPARKRLTMAFCSSKYTFDTMMRNYHSIYADLTSSRSA